MNHFNGQQLHLTPAIPPQVNEAVRAYFDLLMRNDVRFISGIYLLGSVALGDYQNGRSDIDFVALVDAALDDEKCDHLERVHSAMAKLACPSFDGFYIDPSRVRRVPQPEELSTFSLAGSFYRRAPCFECNPVTWLLWSNDGIALFGPKPEALRIATDFDAVRRFQIENLKSYWRSWIEEVSALLLRKSDMEPIDALGLAWGVLGVARIACLLETGRVVSKTGAGIWAADRYGKKHCATANLALAARRGDRRYISAAEAIDALKLVQEMMVIYCDQ